MWSAIQIVFLILGILCALGAERLSMPFLANLGVACFGLMAMAVGWEAIITRHIKLGSRRRGSQETYTGFPAVLQGIQFNLIGLFLIGAAGLAYLNNSREIFLYFIRRPGLPLIVVGLLMLLQSLVLFLGFREINQGQSFIVTLNLIFARMLPGVILLVLGLGALGLGVFEFIAPAAFDDMGGRFLETLYGIR